MNYDFIIIQSTVLQTKIIIIMYVVYISIGDWNGMVPGCYDINLFYAWGSNTKFSMKDWDFQGVIYHSIAN